METAKTKNEVELVEDELDEIQYEDADTYGEIIYAAYNAYSMVDFIDNKLVSQETADIIEEVKEKSLKLVHFAITGMYANNIEENTI